MINNVNPTASKLLEQIKRLSTPTTKKEGKPLDFKNDVMNNRTNNINTLTGTNLLNTIEKTQKKNDIPIQTIENIKKEAIGKNIQTSEWSKPVNVENKVRREPVGSFLDIYL